MPTPNLTFGCNMSLDDYWDVGEFAKYAETLGYDRITTGEHIMDGTPQDRLFLRFRQWQQQQVQHVN